MDQKVRNLRFVGFRRTLDREVDAQRLFGALTDDGTRVGCVLLQSSDNIPKYGERSLAAVGASLRLEGRGDGFIVSAIDERGRCLLPHVRRKLSLIATLQADEGGSIRGKLVPDLRTTSGKQRPFRTNHMDVIRTLAFFGEGDEVREMPTHALFGCFAYTFIHQYEKFDRNPRDVLDEPDYLFFLATRMFMIDHALGKTYLVSSVPVVESMKMADMLVSAEEEVRRMTRLATDPPASASATWRIGEVESDTDPETFRQNVRRIKEDIHAGRMFQAVYGRMLSTPFSGRPFDVYCRLSRVNPSPYMFYVRDETGALLAASPEMAVRVSDEGPDGRRSVEVRPIAGTKPRGFVDGRIDPLVDAKYETALKIDPKELAEHTMLVDLARNDVASVCLPGTTVVDEPFVIEKYSHVQHLVSNVTGVLRDDLDALHAYLATMNMGTVTGAPKLEAMKAINALEQSSRGFFGGSVGYVTPDGRMDTALTIRAIRIKHDRAYVRVAAGIVADSIPESEWDETESKAAACVRVLKEGAWRG